MNAPPDSLLQAFIHHADIGHMALFIWACGASVMVWFGVTEAAETARRTERFMQDFLHELSRFNRKHEEDEP
jgi:hypothetical protein